MLQEQSSWDVNPDFLKKEQERIQSQSSGTGRGKLDNVWGRFVKGDNYIRLIPWSPRGVIAKYIARHKNLPFPGQTDPVSHVCPAKTFPELGIECPICKAIATIEPHTEEAANYFAQHQYWVNAIFFDADPTTHQLKMRLAIPFITRLTGGVYNQLIEKITNNPLCRRSMHPTMGVIYNVNMPASFEGKNTYRLDMFYPNHSLGATEQEIQAILSSAHNLDEVFRAPDSNIMQNMFASASLLVEKYKSLIPGPSTLGMSPSVSAPLAPPDPRIPMAPPAPPPAATVMYAPPPQAVPIVAPSPAIVLPTAPVVTQPVALAPAIAASPAEDEEAGGSEKCPHCERTFKSHRGLSRHMTMSHTAVPGAAVAPIASITLPAPGVPAVAHTPVAAPLPAGLPECMGSYTRMSSTNEGKRKCWMCKYTLPCTTREKGGAA